MLQDYLIRFQYIVHASCNSSKTDKFDFINSCSILHYISSYIMEINIIRILWLLFHGVLINNPEVVFQVNIYKYNVSVFYNFVEKIDIEFAAFVPLLWFVDVFTGISLFHFLQRETKIKVCMNIMTLYRHDWKGFLFWTISLWILYLPIWKSTIKSSRWWY